MSKMGELYTEVCDKLDQESGKDLKLTQMAGLLRARAQESIDVCGAILAEDKTLAGAFKAIEDAARKRYEKDRGQVCVCVTTDEAEEIIAAYYGFALGQAPTPVKTEPRRKVVSLFDM